MDKYINTNVPGELLVSYFPCISKEYYLLYFKRKLSNNNVQLNISQCKCTSVISEVMEMYV